MSENDGPIVSVPTPHPDDVKAVIEMTFKTLVMTAVHTGVLARPAVFQDIDEWIGADLAREFKVACVAALLKLGANLVGAGTVPKSRPRGRHHKPRVKPVENRRKNPASQ